MKDDELGRVYTEGEVIFKEGDEGDHMYVVQSGKVKITRNTPSGDVTIAVLSTGEIFGEMALFDRLPRSATAAAFNEARILSIDKKKFFQTISRDPTLVFKILEYMSQRIRRINEEISKLKNSRHDSSNIFTDTEETCKYILEEARNIIPADNGSIMLIDDAEKTLSIKAAFGTEWNPKTRLQEGEGVAGDVLKTGKAELINNVSMDSRFKSGTAHIQSVMCAPLKWRGNHFGVINMSRCSEKLFTLDDLKMLHSMAIHASVVIENVRCFSQFKNATDEFLRHATMLYT